jgi:hypothetical protein
MEKVYADKKIDFARQKDFDIPVEMANDPISADTDLSTLINLDDSLAEDNGNGDAIDFMNEGYDDPVVPIVKPIDSSKSRSGSEKKQDNKKDPVTGSPKAVLKIGLPDNKTTKPKPNPKPDNDYK